MAIDFSLMAIDFSIFLVGAFQFYKFHENEAKHDKHNFEKGLTVTFKIKSLQNYWKNCLKFGELMFYEGE